MGYLDKYLEKQLDLALEINDIDELRKIENDLGDKNAVIVKVSYKHNYSSQYQKLHDIKEKYSAHKRRFQQWLDNLAEKFNNKIDAKVTRLIENNLEIQEMKRKYDTFNDAHIKINTVNKQVVEKIRKLKELKEKEDRIFRRKYKMPLAAVFDNPENWPKLNKNERHIFCTKTGRVVELKQAIRLISDSREELTKIGDFIGSQLWVRLMYNASNNTRQYFVDLRDKDQIKDVAYEIDNFNAHIKYDDNAYGRFKDTYRTTRSQLYISKEKVK